MRIVHLVADKVVGLAVAVACSVGAMFAAPLAAQCGFAWQSVGGYPGADGIVECAVEWDPDGAGPAPMLAVLGGQFSVVGTAVAPHLVLYEPITDTWAGLGGGVDGPVYALLPLPNGELIVAGDFAHAGGVACRNVARWDGVSWQPLGGGLDGLTVALAVLPNGDVVAGGQFSTAGSVAAANVALWNGASWSSLGAGCNGRVNALAVSASGDLLVGGEFTTAGGIAASRVARWNGSWSPVESGVGANVLSMAFDNGGNMFVVVSGGALVMRWTGAAWFTSGTGLQFWHSGHSVRRAPSGDMLLCGWAALGDPPLFQWNGSSWVVIASATGSGAKSIRAYVQFPNGDYLLGGNFAAPSPFVIRFTGGQRVPIEGGPQATCYDLAQTISGEIVAATAAGLRYQSTSGWLRYGSGSIDPVGVAMTAKPGGGVIVAGAFQHYWTDSWGNSHTAYMPSCVATPNSVFYVPYAWSSYYPASGTAFARLPSGGVLLNYNMGGASRIDVFDATGSIPGYLSMGQQGPLVAVAAMTARSEDEWIAAGNSNVYHRVGGIWSLIGAFNNDVRCLCTAPNGDVYAGGMFTNIGGLVANHVARWDGITWHGVGGGTDGVVDTIHALPDGDLIAGGDFQMAGGLASPYVARWNGAGWSSFGASPNAPVEALMQDHLGRVWIGGRFSSVGSLACGHLARLDPTCPGTVATYGAGCSGTGGANTLTASSLPWLDATFRSHVEGLQPDSIAVVAAGFAPLSLPLQQLFPFALPGCDLLTTPDVTWLTLTGTGAIDVELFLPASSVWLGQQLRQQVLGVELDAAGQLSALNSSNALLLTVGEL